MINNRQGGRRRGRGGQRPQGMPGSGGRDNRNRGNAAQLLEKYKGLARDAQLAGDRVQTEYYLQFADHYYRVLEEIRPQGEQQRRRRDDDDDDFGDEADSPTETRARDNRESRDNRENREGREPQARDQREARDGDGDEERQPRRRTRSRRDRDGERADGDAGDGERLPLSALPPAIGSDDGDDGEEKPKRRRTRKPRTEGDGAEADAA